MAKQKSSGSKSKPGKGKATPLAGGKKGPAGKAAKKVVQTPRRVPDKTPARVEPAPDPNLGDDVVQ